MEIDKKDATGTGLFTMSRLSPEELTHKAVEDYLSKGRHMQSAYVTELLNRLFRLLGAVLIRALGWVGAMPGGKRRRGIEISMKWFGYISTTFRKACIAICCPISPSSPCRPRARLMGFLVTMLPTVVAMSGA
jgi:hypothetical protein